MEEPTLEYMPAQDIPKTGADMRASAGPIKRGYKVGYSSTANTTKTQPLVKASKRKREEADTVDGMDIDGAADVDFGPPDTKKRNVVSRDVSGVASTKSWKTPVKARHSASKSIASAKTWDKKMEEKRIKKTNQLNAQAARDNYKDGQTAKRKQREEAHKKKEENRKKSAVVQNVSTATAKRMLKTKKGRSQLTTG